MSDQSSERVHPQIRVLLADDHKLMRKGLCHILSHNSCNIVGEASDGREAIALAWELQPQVVLMDIAMPEMNGIEATRRITDGLASSHVLVLSVHAGRDYFFQSMKAGARGYLQKDCTADELVEAVHQVARGEYYFGVSISENFIQELLFRQEGEDQNAFSLLTSRECEVLQLLAEGWNTKKIAYELNVSSKTVEFHRLQIMKKLNLFTIADLTKYAIREGLTSL